MSSLAALSTGERCAAGGSPVPRRSRAGTTADKEPRRVRSDEPSCASAPNRSGRAAFTEEAARQPAHGPATIAPSISEYATGTTIKVSRVEVISPPITHTAIGARVSPPSLIASATGSMPKIIAAVVITIGRSRMMPASISASVERLPSRRELIREVDQQDRVLRDEAHQHDHADHREDVERLAGEVQRRRTRRPRTAAATA